MESIQVRHSDAVVQMASAANIFVATWWNAPSVELLRVLDRHTKRFRDEWPAGIGYSNLVVSGVPNFSAEVREEAARLTSDYDPRDLATSHVILVGGLIGAAVRAFLSTAMLVGKPKVPTKVFGDTRAAGIWMADRLTAHRAKSWTAQDIESVLDRLRERVGAG